MTHGQTIQSESPVDPVTFYHKGTSGIGILVVHGFSMSPRETDKICRYYADRNFTVLRPILPGHGVGIETLAKVGPDEWYACVQENYNILRTHVDHVFVVGVSFGGNLATHLASEHSDDSKMAGLVTLEMPVRFVPRVQFAVSVIQPTLSFFHIPFIRKNKFFYRHKYSLENSGEASVFIPVETAGKLWRFAKTNTLKDLSRLRVPVLFIQARKSDLLHRTNLPLLTSAVTHTAYKTYIVPVNNHDLNLLDEESYKEFLVEMRGFFEETVRTVNPTFDVRISVPALTHSTI
jgi:carboxylesterase